VKLESFENDGATLASHVPAEKEELETLLAGVGDMLQQLLSSLATRRRKLEQSLELQQFLSEHKNVR
jgi:arsenate reductase-like glutaredoxin family protein